MEDRNVHPGYAEWLGPYGSGNGCLVVLGTAVVDEN